MEITNVTVNKQNELHKILSFLLLFQYFNKNVNWHTYILYKYRSDLVLNTEAWENSNL
jgi:hypothetical protein